jgi:HAD superfamily hydrolase (TIGR01549 family)
MSCPRQVANANRIQARNGGKYGHSIACKALPGSRAILIAVRTGISRDLAFIFDLDGVLVDSMPLHVEAWRQYLTLHSIPVDDLEGAMHGRRNSELVRGWFGEQLTEDLVLGHGAAKERLWRELIVKEGLDRYRIAGIVDFLDRYPHVPKAIGSNAEPENIDFVLDRFGLRKYFTVVVDGFQVAHAKPAPDIYLKCAELLKVDPAHCIVFEDSPVGIEAARRAGMRAIGIETSAAGFEHVEFSVKDFTDPRLHEWIASLV